MRGLFTKQVYQTLLRLASEDGADPNWNRTGFEWPSDGNIIRTSNFIPLLIAGVAEVRNGRLCLSARGRECIASRAKENLQAHLRNGFLDRETSVYPYT